MRRKGTEGSRGSSRRSPDQPPRALQHKETTKSAGTQAARRTTQRTWDAPGCFWFLLALAAMKSSSICVIPSQVNNTTRHQARSDHRHAYSRHSERRQRRSKPTTEGPTVRTVSAASPLPTAPVILLAAPNTPVNVFFSSEIEPCQKHSTEISTGEGERRASPLRDRRRTLAGRAPSPVMVATRFSTRGTEHAGGRRLTLAGS
jgi:hypothetical protein